MQTFEKVLEIFADYLAADETIEVYILSLIHISHPEDGFAGMEIRGDLLTDKENAGAALLDACKERCV